jgi:20S proteasome alpha/beta subunit
VLTSNFKSSDIEVGVVTKGEKFRKLEEKEIEEHLTIIAQKD